MDFTEVIDIEKVGSIPKHSVVGIDIGSRQSKAVLFSEKGLFTALVPTGFYMQETADELFEDLLKQSGLKREDIEYIVSTGYGRIALKFDDIPNSIVTEIACHGMGAHFLGHDIHTVIDIGGQDSKALKIDPETGRVLDFAMNDKCAAGTGRFLERIAAVLGMDVKSIGPVSLKSENGTDISAQCIVFAESEVVSERAKGTKVEDIAYGIHKSVARRVNSLLNRVGIEKNVLFTGGVSNNIGIKRAFEELLGFPIEDSRLDTVYAGALGAAVFAVDNASKKAVQNDDSAPKFELDLNSLNDAVAFERELITKKAAGKKNVGYVCAYVPLEILESANVSHFRIMTAGNQDEIMAGESITQSVFCDLTKSVIGGFITENPVFHALDQVYTFFTCDCMRKTVEVINNSYVPATVYNLPRLLTSNDGDEYYISELNSFKSDLEKLTGEKIDDSVISTNIDKYNKARQLIRKIASYRKYDHPLLTGSQFQRITKSYYYLPVDMLISELEKIVEQLQNAAEPGGPVKPRVMLAGGILADGDNKVTSIIEALGANVVAEDNCSGLRPFTNDIPNSGSWQNDIAAGYRGQAPCARMKPVDKMIEYSLKMAKEYRAEGVVFYYLKFCPCYSMIIRKYIDAFQKENIPVLVVSSDYSKGDEGQIKIRTEAFIEMLNGGRDNG